ncbi:hypothetical protein TcBrA4_0006170 [Trypanosoma cruzi]|nr:hypothetical protein TcBrA4_0006170 [Trypanosoma cruzi]
MMMVTVRRCVACDLLVLALLVLLLLLVRLQGCCFGRAIYHCVDTILVEVEVLSAETDGKLRWRLQDEKDWRKCARRPEEAPEAVTTVHGYAMRLGVSTTIRTLLNCAFFGSDPNNAAFQMKFETHGDLKNCSLGETPSIDRVTWGAQHLAGAAPAVASADGVRRQRAASKFRRGT